MDTGTKKGIAAAKLNLKEQFKKQQKLQKI